MAQNFWGAIWAWSACFAVTVAIEILAKYEALFRAAGFHPGEVTPSSLAATKPAIRTTSAPGRSARTSSLSSTSSRAW